MLEGQGCVTTPSERVNSSKHCTLQFSKCQSSTFRQLWDSRSRRVHVTFKVKPPVAGRSNRRKRQKQTGSPSTLQALKSDCALAIGNDTGQEGAAGKVICSLRPPFTSPRRGSSEGRGSSCKEGTLVRQQPQGAHADPRLDMTTLWS